MSAKRLDVLLLVVIAAEVIVAVVSRTDQTTTRLAPPIPLFSKEDASADDLKRLAGNCEDFSDWLRLGEDYLANGFFPESAACYSGSVELRPNSSDARYRWAFVLSRIGACKKSNVQFRKAVELGHPEPDRCWYFIGRNCLRIERVKEAEQAFERAATILAAKFESAKLAFVRKDDAKALRLLEPFLTGHPDLIEPLQLGYLLAFERGDPRRASIFREAADRARFDIPTPLDVEAEKLSAARKRLGYHNKYNRAVSLYNNGSTDLAAKLLGELQEQEWNAAVQSFSARVAQRQGRLDRSVVLLLELIRRQGLRTDRFERLGDAYAKLGRRDDARKAWRRAAEVGTRENLETVHRKLAEDARLAGDDDVKKRYLALAGLEAGKYLLRNSRFKRAHAVLQTAAQQLPDSPAAWFYFGESCRLLNKPSPARRAYQRCLSIDPGHGRAHRRMGLLPSDEPAKQNGK